MTDELRRPDVILVNGPSSTGKSTLCRTLRARIAHPCLCVGFDDFIGFSAPRSYTGAGSVGVTPLGDGTTHPGDWTAAIP
jgi:chloramphenicol 3-O-phosphotransferase